MRKRLLILLFIFFTVVVFASAELRYSIRYHNKNIYYPSSPIELKLTLSNTITPDSKDEYFVIADDLRHSFGFDLRTLTGYPIPFAEGYIHALNNPGSYRHIYLAPGQELSMVINLNEWVDISRSDQYRLSGYFYPRLRGEDKEICQADTVVNLTVLPETEQRWTEQLNAEIREALINRNIDPWNVVNETLQSRSRSKYNRAIIYLDIDSLARNLPEVSDAVSLEKALTKGSWEQLPGFRIPAKNWEMISTKIYQEEAIVELIASYEPQGKLFRDNIRFYLHRNHGYWSIRRIEALSESEYTDLQKYGSMSLNPPEIVEELIQSAIRGDWEVVLRYYDVDDLVSSLPEYSNQWNKMNSQEHKLAIRNYKEELISGKIQENQLPLADMEEWEIIGVNYTSNSGTVLVKNMKTHPTLAGTLTQSTLYTFRLKRSEGINKRWQVVRYDTTRLIE